MSISDPKESVKLTTHAKRRLRSLEKALRNIAMEKGVEPIAVAN